MKILKTAILTATLGLTANANALLFWHSDTVYINGGMCSASFTFDSGGFNEYHDLVVQVVGINPSGTPLLTGALHIDSFGTSNATRYATAFLEDEEACESELKIHVTKATAQVNGEYLNLLEEGLLRARPFKPYEIFVPEANE